jgi:hypothetical protein
MNAILFALRTGLPRECAGRRGNLFARFIVPAFPGMDGGGGIRDVLAYRIGRARRAEGDRLVLVVNGWRDEQSAVVRLRKTVPNPADRGEQGVKRGLLTEAAGMPQGLCLDKGYDFDEARDIAMAFGLTARIRARGEETRNIKQEAGFKARRWVVERTHKLDESLSPDPRAPGETPHRLRHHHLARYWPMK